MTKRNKQRKQAKNNSWANKLENFNKFQKRNDCHSGNVKVFNAHLFDGNITVYGGGSTRANNPDVADVIIDLTDGNNKPLNLSVDSFGRLFTSKQRYIAIDCADYSIPRLERDFWDNLVSSLKEQASGKESLYVLVSCLGGHGRTGTVLAILANKLLNINSPIKLVRENYCNLAVESARQVSYIKKITGTAENIKIEDYSLRDIPLNNYGGTYSGGYDAKKYSSFENENLDFYNTGIGKEDLNAQYRLEALDIEFSNQSVFEAIEIVTKRIINLENDLRDKGKFRQDEIISKLEALEDLDKYLSDLYKVADAQVS